MAAKVTRKMASKKLERRQVRRAEHLVADLACAIEAMDDLLQLGAPKGLDQDPRFRSFMYLSGRSRELVASLEDVVTSL